jgi:hypothetical protein
VDLGNILSVQHLLDLAQFALLLQLTPQSRLLLDLELKVASRLVLLQLALDEQREENADAGSGALQRLNALHQRRVNRLGLDSRQLAHDVAQLCVDEFALVVQVIHLVAHLGELRINSLLPLQLYLKSGLLRQQLLQLLVDLG